MRTQNRPISNDRSYRSRNYQASDLDECSPFDATCVLRESFQRNKVARLLLLGLHVQIKMLANLHQGNIPNKNYYAKSHVYRGKKV